MERDPDQGKQGTREQTYANLIELWTCGIRDYHSLLSDYLTANSIFVAAIGFLLARPSLPLIFTLVVLILCLFGMLMAIQMAIVLGRFSAQNALWEWRIRGIEKDSREMSYKLFSDLHRFRRGRETLTDAENNPPQFTPNWATRQHRQWWAAGKSASRCFSASSTPCFLCGELFS